MSIYRAFSTMGTPERLQEFALRERRGRVMRMYAGGEVAKKVAHIPRKSGCFQTP